MTIYLLHFDPPYQHARHYLGFVEDNGRSMSEAVLSRLAYHLSGRGNPLVHAAAKGGCVIHIARIWPLATRDEERRLKNGKNVPKICPRCIHVQREPNAPSSLGVGPVTGRTNGPQEVQDR